MTHTIEQQMRDLGQPDLTEPGFEEPARMYVAIVEQLRDDLNPTDLRQVSDALDVAWMLHHGQFRASTTIPYITHPLSNVQRLVEHGVRDPEVLAAGALHDSVEDCHHEWATHVGFVATEEDPAAREEQERAVLQHAIDVRFGEETGRIVAGVTNEVRKAPSQSREESNVAFVAHARTKIMASFGVFAVKWVDYLDNAGTLAQAKFADQTRKVRLAQKYLPMGEAFGEAKAHHESAGTFNLPKLGVEMVESELARIQGDLEGILASAA